MVLGNRFAKKPLHLKIPVTIAGMSFGALSANAKEALGRGATIAGTSTTTGDGGMTPEERGQSQHLVYQYLPSRYGMNPDDLRKADAIEIVTGQGAKPGGGGMLLGMKVTERVAGMRTLPVGVDQRSACRHPDWTGPDDTAIKIAEIREITDWEKPIYVKIGASRPYYDVKLAVKAGADVIVLDGMQGGTAATQEVFIEHVGIPILPAIPQAVQALQEMGMHRKVQLIVSGGSATVPTSPKPWHWARMRWRSVQRRSSRWATTIHALDEELKKSARLPVSTTTGRTAVTRPASPPGPELSNVSTRSKAGDTDQLPARTGPRSPDHGPCLRQITPAQPRPGRPRGADRRIRRDGARATGRNVVDTGFGFWALIVM